MRVFKYEEFPVDETERGLFRVGTPMLAPKIFDILLVPVKNQGRLATKDALMSEAWREIFIWEDNLVQYIFVLPKILDLN